ncbi:MAG: MMPL family transporter [Bacteroidetes bacterium]|nr:MMPL family transporter [Bacteroidota bacterium]
MWEKISHFILRNRVVILVLMLLVTGFMGWKAKTNLELSYKYARVLPVDDSMYIAYEKFKAKYGEDGNVMVIGFKDTGMFQFNKFRDWYDLTDSIGKINGVENVMSTARLYNLQPNDSIEKLDVLPVVNRRPQSQEECDSIKKIILRLPFYEGLIITKKKTAGVDVPQVTVLAITFTQKDLNSKNRLAIVGKIRDYVNHFGIKNHEEMHLSGMPWIRSEYMRKISGESTLLLVLSILVTALILFIFFRYFNAVFFSLIIVIVGLIWSVGTIALFDYKITILSGLIPSLIVIIGIPNCIFLINKYQEELVAHGNKTKALSRMVQKVGLSNFLANLTTSIGFGVFYFTNSSMLVEFGVVAAINVMTTYFIALVLTPITFSYLPEPKPKQMKHLSGKRINKILALVDKLVHHHRKAIYLGIALATIIATLGFFKVKINGYVVDDLPKNDPLYLDLKFFEKNFKGVLPFEVALEVKPFLTDSMKRDLAKKGIKPNPDDYAPDTLGPKNIFLPNGEVLFNIDSLQRFVDSRPEFSKPVSVVEAVKFTNQALNNGKVKAYRVPHDMISLQRIANYSNPNKEGKKLNESNKQKLNTFLDSTYRSTRLSFQMADVGSDSSKRIMAKIQPVVDSLFPRKYFKVDLTGNSRMFLRSFDYMLHHLFVSLLIAIGLILLLGMALFRSVWIIVLSKLPCLIPLVMTAGIMGYLGIPFKSSTILIFSIAFGIASDGTIYILTAYRHQLRKLSAANASKAVSLAIKETGLSMIYTNIILFFGFAIFLVSSFGGTVALGILLSITLIVSLATNLVLLPCLLLSLEKRASTKALMKEPLIEIYDEEEDIDADKLKIHHGHHHH